jgi:ligand-binding SRPBCC domain-containing protein
VKLYCLRRIQTIPVSLEKAWDFFSSPLNLPLITPSWLNLKITEKLPDQMFPGMMICYRVKPLFGISLTWITEITHVDIPNYFVDEQRFGPYRFWQHQHHFRQTDDGVEMTDVVHYVLKFGLFGTMIHAVHIRKQLEKIFDFRQKMLENLF